jgi:BASS family bile acid:Na+ symporter
MSSLLFPVFAILFSFYAYISPEWLAAQKSLIIPCLIVIMFSMGLSLTKEDFVRALAKPQIILVGMALQYTIMPLAAFLIARSLGLSLELTAGMVLLGATAGGTASNVICYLAKADVALSVTLTAVSTLISVVATPLLTYMYLGQSLDVPVSSMLLSILKIVVAPVLAGVLINQFFYQYTKRLHTVLPWISIAAIVFVIGIIVALNVERLATVGGVIIAAIVLHNLIGLTSGYAIAKKLGYDEKTAKTLAIEVGMQNSGLSVALAIKYFSASAAIPGALFSIWHNLSGAILAAWWNRKKSNNSD